MASPQSETYSGLSAWRRGGGRLPGPGSATSSSVGIQRTLERDKVEVGTFLFYETFEVSKFPVLKWFWNKYAVQKKGGNSALHFN